MKLIKHILFICNIIITLLLSSCDDGIKRVLAEAGDNRGELEKVLAYFNDEQDDLKRSSANFLIRNMPYNYTYSGRFMDVLDSAYMIMSEYPLPKRHDEYKRMTDFIVDDRVMVSDIHSVKADYLIKILMKRAIHGRKPHGARTIPMKYSLIMCFLTVCRMSKSAIGAASFMINILFFFQTIF